MFSINEGKGFTITFPNGWSVSVQWGPGNYASNYDKPRTMDDRWQYDSPDAEVAIFYNGRLMKYRYKDTTGWLKPDAVARIIAQCADGSIDKERKKRT